MDLQDRDRLQDAKAEALADLLHVGLAESGQAGCEEETPSVSDVSQSSYAHPHILGYDVIRELHRGGQGVIFEAVQRSTKRAVAVKILLHGPQASKVAQKRFEREIELVAQLNHPNIIAIFESGVTVEGLQFHVMDFVRGLPLNQYVRNNTLSLKDMLSLFATVCDAIQYAHQRGVIHRDLKPSNILVDTEGHPKILDFGLAKLLSAPAETLVSVSREVIGTLPYMSPEQARGNADEIDVRSDVYALGVILYELLTGHYPYMVQGPIPEVLRHIAESQPVPPTRRWSSDSVIAKRATRRFRSNECPIDGEVQTITLKALEKERERRYQSAGELARDIRHNLAGEPIEAKQASTWYVLKKSVQRHRVGVVAGAVVLGSIVGALFFSVLFWRQAANERDRLRQTTYYRQIGVAQAAYNNNQIARMKELLSSCPKDLRGWEWYHLLWLSDRSLRTFRGHEAGFRYMFRAGVREAAFSSDGRRIVSGGQDKTVRIWDVNAAKELLPPMHGHEDAVMSVAFSPDDQRIVSAGGDGTVRVWHAGTGKQLLPPFTGHKGDVFSAVFSPDGAQIISGGADGMIKIWDSATGALIDNLNAHAEWIRDVAVDPTGCRIASVGNDGMLKIWDAQTRALRLAIEGDEDEFSSIAFSPDGTQVASGGKDSTVRMWDADTGALLQRFTGHTGGVGPAAFSLDGKWMVSGGGDLTIRVWDAERGTEVRTLRGHDFTLTSVSFSPDGRFILSASEDATVKLWDFKPTERDVSVDGIEGAHWPAAFSPDGRYVVSGADERNLKVWDALTGDELQTLSGHERRVHSVAFSPDGQLVVSGSYDGTARLWNPSTGEQVRTLPGHDEGVTCVGFSPDGRLVLSGGIEGTLRVSVVATGRKILTLEGHGGGVGAAAFTPDGRHIVSGSGDGTLSVWRVSDGHCLLKWAGHNADAGSRCDIQSVAIAPDGRTFASGGNDNMVRLWDVKTGKLIWTMQGHEYDVRSVAFNRDGTRLASISADETVRIWDPATGQETIVLLRFMDEGHGVAFSPDGRRLMSDFRKNSLIVWDSMPVQ